MYTAYNTNKISKDIKYEEEKSKQNEIHPPRFAVTLPVFPVSGRHINKHSSFHFHIMGKQLLILSQLVTI